MVSSSARHSYRKRRRSSHCVGLRAKSCRNSYGCSYTKGKRKFCRRDWNTKRRGKSVGRRKSVGHRIKNGGSRRTRRIRLR